MREETIQEGVVVSVGPGRIMVRVDKSDEDCGGCRACSLKSMCRDKSGKQLDIPVSLGSMATRPKPGDTVRIAYRAANAGVAALILFLPALLGLFFGGFAANHVVDAGDGIFLLGCLAGLILGLAVTIAISRASKALRPGVRLLSA